MASPQSSYLRSSADRLARPQGYPAAYPTPFVYNPVEDDELLVAGTPSSGGSVSSMATDCSSHTQIQGYTVQSEYDPSSAPSQPYAEMDLYPRKQWSGELHGLHHDYNQSHFEPQSMPVSLPASTLHQQTAPLNRPHFQISPAGMAVLPNFETSPSESFMNAYGTVSSQNSITTSRSYSNPQRVGTSPTATYTYQPTYSQQNATQDYVQQITVEQPPTFQLPPSPVEANPRLTFSPSESPPQFVSLSEVSPSPTISPKLLLQHIDQLPPEPATNAAIMTSVHIGAEGTNSSADGEFEADEDVTIIHPSRGTRSAPSSPPKKRRRKIDFTSSEESDNRSSGDSDSGESEFMRDEESADEDEEYIGPQVRRRSVRRCASVIETSSMPSPRRIPIPVPVPNLTKKSRGRRVPTEPTLIAQDGIVKVGAHPSI